MSMNEFIVTLNDAQVKALAYAVCEPSEWIQYTISERCRIAMEEIFHLEVQRMVNDPTVSEIPADREAVVLAANIKSAAERNADASEMFLSENT